MIPLLGFVPDAPSATPGVLTDCTQLIPSERGMRSAPSAVSGGFSALPSSARGAAVLTNTSGTRRTIAGTQTKLFEFSAGTYSDVSGGTYTGSSENRWMFAQFGNAAIATNDTERIQASTSGTFSGITNAPIARMVVAVPNFLVALDTNDSPGSATFGDSPDRWWCCAYQNHADWAPSVTTQAATGRIVGGNGGGFTAGAPFGSGLVAYKAREMYLGQYVGPPVVFQFDHIPGDQGCVGPEAVVDIGGAHIFVGDDNIWLYDGTRPVPIANEIRRWFFADISTIYKYRTIVTYDRNNGLVWIFYQADAASGSPDSAVVYHLGTKRWGRANRGVEAVFNYMAPGLTWDTLNTLSSTWDGMPNIPWDSQFWQSGGRSLAFFDTAHTLRTLTGNGENAGMTTGDFGDDEAVTSVNRVLLRFESEPVSAAISGQLKDGLGAAMRPGGSGALASSKFDIRQSGRWHRFAFQFTGSTEISGIDVPSTPAGRR